MLRPLASALLAFAVVAAAPAHAADRPIVAIEVHSQVSREGRDLKGELRAALQKEVDAMDFKETPRGARFTLSASLLKLDSSTDGGKVRSSARVSVVLKNGRGAVQAILQGRATAEDAPSAARRAEQGALEAAVQSAVKPLPGAVRLDRRREAAARSPRGLPRTDPLRSREGAPGGSPARCGPGRSGVRRVSLGPAKGPGRGR
jgi:hypothetical protein